MKLEIRLVIPNDRYGALAKLLDLNKCSS